MTKARDYYDLLAADGKADLCLELNRGPQSAIEGIAPDASDEQRARVGVKRFVDKFHRSDKCRMGHYLPDVAYESRTISQRLIADGYLSQ